MPERLAKYLAQRNVCSRRQAERWIAEGKIIVNGIAVTSPVTFVSTSDSITVNGESVGSSERPRLWIYAKPRGEVTTHRDPSGRRTVFESVQTLGLSRVVSVGRLDLNSEGLILLTNRSTLAHALEVPNQALPRVYRVRLFGCVATKSFSRARASSATFFLMPSLTVDGFRYAPWTLQFDVPLRRLAQHPAAQNFWATVTLVEGKNREIRKLMNALGFQVNRLIRQQYGPFSLGSLATGHVKEVISWREDLERMSFPLPRDL